MTVTTAYAPLTHNCNGSATAFSVTWPFFLATDLVVTHITSSGVETVLTNVTDYTVTGGRDATTGLPAVGTVTTVATYASGVKIRITRATPRTQSTSFTTTGAFPAKSVEAAIDRVHMIAEEGGVNGTPDIDGAVLRLETSGATDYWDGENYIARGFADPVDDDDLATRGWVTSQITAETIGNLDFTQNGTGAVDRTWLSKLREWVYVDDFGAVGDGTTADTTAFTNAMASLGATGGIVWISAAKQYRIGSITVPANVAIHGHAIGLDSTPDNITFNFDDMGSTLLLNSGATITLLTGAAVTNCLIRPYGLSLSQTSSAAWADTAVTVAGYGAAVINNIILGFNRGVYSNGYSRVRIEWNSIDANTAIDARGSYDTTRILNNHCWPYLTHTAYWNSGVDEASRDDTMLCRTGTGLYLASGTADTRVDGNLFFGYLVGMRLYNSGGANFGLNWVDHPYGMNRTDNYGVILEGTVDNLMMQGMFVWGNKIGLYSNAAGALAFDTLHIEKIDFEAAILASGNIRIGHLKAHDCGSYAVNVTHATNVTLDLNSYDFRDIDAAVAISLPANASTEYISLGQGTSDEADGTPLIGTNNLLFPEVASGSTVNLPAHGTWFTVTGTTTIDSIAGAWGGRRIVLRFAAGSCSVAASGGNITLDKAFTSAAAGSTLELYYDGHSSTWRELSRNVGQVDGPASSTDNAIARWDGTNGRKVQSSGVTIDDSNNVVFPASVFVQNGGLKLADTNGTHNLVISPGSDLTAERTLTVTTGDANRTIDLVSLLGAWTSYTPSLSAGSGSFTSATTSGKYRTVGKTTEFVASVTITTNGTAAVAVVLGLPNTSANTAYVFGREDGTGAMCVGAIGAGGTTAFCINYTNTYPGGSGVTLIISGVYENT